MGGERKYSYKVAGLTFTVVAPDCYDVEGLLPSFAPFRVHPGGSVTSTGSVTSAGSVTSTGSVTGDDDPVTGKDWSLSLSKGLTLRQAHMSDAKVLKPELLFNFTLQSKPIDIPKNAERVEEDDNDMGHTRLSRTADGSYCLELWYDRSDDRQATESGNGAPTNGTPANGGTLPRPGIFMANAGFTSVTASIEPDSPDCGLILTSMLRIAFAQSVLSRDGISIHASAVAADGKAWLFLGKSGTGKSTHARLWLRNIPGARLLNDDNPTVRLVDGKAIAFGTPWSGKTPCYRNESYPVGGIVRLVRGDADIFTKKDEVGALVALLPSCSVVHSDAELQSRLCDTLAGIAGTVPVGELKCLPDNEAAILCHKNLKSLIK